MSKCSPKFFFFLVAVECHQYSQFDAWIAQQMVVNISDPVPTDGLCVRVRVGQVLL